MVDTMAKMMRIFDPPTNRLRKFVTLALKISGGCAGLLFLFGAFYFYNNRLFLIEAKIIWPQKKFDREVFRAGTTRDRASMAVDLVESKTFIGLPISNVRDILGDPTGDYYHQDTNYTYRLTDKGRSDWILTFVSDDEGKVRRVFIRKDCCSMSQEILHVGLEIVTPLIEKVFKW